MTQPPSGPGAVQPPRMYALPNQSMTSISHGMAPTGASSGGPSKIDPNQIPRPIPSSAVILHETRQGDQANPPPVNPSFTIPFFHMHCCFRDKSNFLMVVLLI